MDFVSVELLCKLTKMIRTFSTNETGFIHMNGLGGGYTHMHAYITDKNNITDKIYLKKIVAC